MSNLININWNIGTHAGQHILELIKTAKELNQQVRSVVYDVQIIVAPTVEVIVPEFVEIELKDIYYTQYLNAKESTKELFIK